MKRFLKVAGVTLLILAVVGAGALFYIDYKVSKMMAGMAKQREVALASQENETDTSLDDASSVGADAISEAPAPVNEDTGNKPEPAEADTQSGVKEENKVDQVPDKSMQEAEAPAVETETDPEELATSIEKTTEDVTEETTVENTEENSVETTEEITAETTAETTVEATPVEEAPVVEETPSIEEVEEEVNWAEKAKAYDMAISRLTSAQVSRLYEMAEGGFTPEEKKEAKDMFYSNFTAEEQEWILEMYRKYY